jgi:pyruvate dehydrogenase E1 component alpha subunit
MMSSGQDKLRDMYSVMLRIRKLEERLSGILEQGDTIICPVHLYTGQEAVATGVCASLRREDYVFSTHRSHGHYIAKGGDLKALVAEVFCKATGCSMGRGGSMHLSSPENGFPGSSAIVGGTIPIAAGAALAFSIMKKDNVSVAFFGDGAAGEGVLYEAMNLAALRNLPVIFVCENNLYSTHMPVALSLADTSIYKKAEAFGLLSARVDGNNVMEVYNAAREVIEAARKGQGPAFLECMTYRWRGHVGPNYDLDKGLRSREELDSWIEKCPIRMLEEYLTKNGILSELEKDRINREIDEEIESAVASALEAPYPDESELTSNVYVNLGQE